MGRRAEAEHKLKGSFDREAPGSSLRPPGLSSKVRVLCQRGNGLIRGALPRLFSATWLSCVSWDHM